MSRLRRPVIPMKAVIGTLPSEHDDHRWAYEVKWDGYRTVVFVDAASQRVRVQSSSGRDVTASYPELAAIWQSLQAADAVIDGEIVVFGSDGLPNFGALQRHNSQVVFHAFDLLELDGNEVTGLPYEQRRALLHDVLRPALNWLVPAHRVGGGAELLAATAEQRMEGVVAKRLGSTYHPGRRSQAWRKVKNRRRVEVTIGGFTRGAGQRAGTFGALLVGVPDGTGRLRFVGGVGTGFSTERLHDLHRRLAMLATQRCPFDPPPPRSYLRDATWVQPQLRAAVEITELTNEGFVRHASFVGESG